MSQLDSEINALQVRLAALEEQKRMQKEDELMKKTFPLKTLGDFIDEKKKNIQRTSTSNIARMGRINDRHQLAYLEPIFLALKDILERLEALEEKK